MPTKGRKAMKARERRRRRVRALAARMPEELFERILGYMGVDWRDEGAVRYSKKELGQCALVSTFWAPRCQARIFREIRLLSGKDVRDLLAMLDRPGTKIAQYIQGLRVLDLNRHGPPWWHLVTLLYKRLQLSSRHSLYLLSPFPEKRTLRTIHPLLPRTVPAHNTRLHELKLSSISFACFGDLIHLLDELRDLRRLTCFQLTWAKGPPLTRLRSTRPRSTCLESIELYSSPPDKYTLWLLSVYRAPPNALRLNVDDSFYPVLCAFLVTTISEKPDQDECSRLAVRDSRQTTVWLTTNQMHYSPKLLWPSTHGAGEASSSVSVHPPVIALDFTKNNVPLDDVLHGEWPSFDALLSSLPHVHKVILGFGTSNDMSRFVQDVVEKSLIHLRTNLEYSCAIFHREGFDDEPREWRTSFVSADPKEAAGMKPKLLTEF